MHRARRLSRGARRAQRKGGERTGSPKAHGWLRSTVDVSDYVACRSAVEQTIAELGGLHALVNNAALALGAIRADHQKAAIGIRELSPAVWQRFVATKFSMTRASIEHMLAAQRPHPCKAALEAMSAGHAEELAVVRRPAERQCRVPAGWPGLGPAALAPKPSDDCARS